MNDDNNLKLTKNKIFFIISNQSKLDEILQYSLLKEDGMENLNCILKKPIKYRREEFIINVFYFEIVPEQLKDKYKDIQSNSYKAIINLKYKNTNFEGNILFKKYKNNFIYDFKFNNSYNIFFGKSTPPLSLKYSKSEQLQIFNEVLRLLKAKQGDILYKDLITDSQCYIKKQNYYFDFYLDIFKSCYSQIEIKSLLMMFDLNRTLLPEKMEIIQYTSLLRMIEKKPSIIIKHCNEEENKDNYYKVFYTILLYFRYMYDKDKVQELLSNKNLYKYLVEILPINYKYFNNLNIPEDLIFEMFKQQRLSYKIIVGIFSYIQSTEKLLLIINSNCDIIEKYCINENQRINMSEIVNPKETDNLNKIINEIEKILNYQLNNQKIFILFDEQFWNNYIQYNKKI